MSDGALTDAIKGPDVAGLAERAGIGKASLVDILTWGRYRPRLIRHMLFDEVESFHKVNNWRKTVAKRTFTIELKADFDENDERYEPFLKVVQEKARELLAVATLLAHGKQVPQVVAFTEDNFFDTKDIDLNLGGEDADTSAVTAEVTAPEAPAAPTDQSDGLDV